MNFTIFTFIFSIFTSQLEAVHKLRLQEDGGKLVVKNINFLLTFIPQKM